MLKSPILNSPKLKSPTLKSPMLKSPTLKSPLLKSPTLNSPMPKSPNICSITDCVYQSFGSNFLYLLSYSCVNDNFSGRKMVWPRVWGSLSKAGGNSYI